MFSKCFPELDPSIQAVATEYFLETILILGTRDSLKKLYRNATDEHKGKKAKII